MGGGSTRRHGPFAWRHVLLADAYATYAPDGTAFCSFLGSPRRGKSDLWVYRSSDGGQRWEGPSSVPGFLDYPRLVADLNDGKPRLFVAANGPGDGPVFGDAKRAGYGCVILRSDDGARTFSAVNLLAPTTLLHTPVESPLVLPDGRLLVAFVDFPDVAEGKGPHAQAAHMTHGRVYAATSRDGGATFSLPALVRDSPLLGESLDGFVVVAADRSDGPYKGRVYAVGYNSSDNPAGLQLQTSTDGAAWTPPVAVPGLRAGPCPYAAVAVSPKGVLGLCWIQCAPGETVRPRNKAWSSKEHDWDLYFTASADGGVTWAAPMPVLESSSRTDSGMGFWGFGGDYISLAASGDGTFHPLWIETRDGRGEIQTTRIEVKC